MTAAARPRGAVDSVARLRRERAGTIVDLTRAPVVGEGGQARIYAVAPDLVAKIYHRPTALHARKLDAMLRTPPLEAPGAHVATAWPLDLLWTTGETPRVAGFVMPRLHAMRPAFEMFNPRSRRLHCPGFGYRYLHRAARNLAAAVGGVHARGHVIGDLNESNVLVGDDALVTLVDTDSFQIRDAVSGEVHPCPVGKAEFTAPELQGVAFAATRRDETHDRFALAVLVFQLLMEGTHPFMGEWLGAGEAPPLEARIAAGESPFVRDGIPWRAPRHAPPLELLAPAVRALVVAALRDGHDDPARRPAAAEWQHALGAAERALVECGERPTHLFGAHLDACPWCERARRLGGRDPFPEPEEAAREAASRPRVAPPPSVVAALEAGPAPVPVGPRPRQAAPRAPNMAPFPAPDPPTVPTRILGMPSHVAYGVGTVLAGWWFVSALATGSVGGLVIAAAMLWNMGSSGFIAVDEAGGSTWRWSLGVGAAFALSFLLVYGPSLLTFLGRAPDAPIAAAEAQRIQMLGEPRAPAPGMGAMLPLRDVRAYDDFSCGIGAGNAVYCWGADDFGALARPAGRAGASPAPVAAAAIPRGIARLAPGVGEHACAVTLGGALACWGNDVLGQASPPGEDPRAPGPPTRWRAVAVGGAHSCAIAVDGALRCFGSNDYGQLGVRRAGSTVMRERLGGWREVAAGGAHSCAIADEDGAVYCWGRDDAGQLGAGGAFSPCALRDVPCAHAPLRIALHEGVPAVAVVAGERHSCALLADQRVLCWGADDVGQLGIGGAPDECLVDRGRIPCSRTPVEVAGGRRYATLTAGASHGCAVEPQGIARCWGLDDYRQLGVEATGESCGGRPCARTPRPVAGVQRFVRLSAGTRHTCGVTSGSATVCWGGNDRGQLGIGRTSGPVALSEALAMGSGAGSPDATRIGVRGTVARPPGVPDSVLVRLAAGERWVFAEHAVTRRAMPGPLAPAPPGGQRPRLAGRVTATIVVDADGRPFLERLEGDALSSVADAEYVHSRLQGSTFRPAERDGRPVAQRLTMVIDFGDEGTPR